MQFLFTLALLVYPAWLGAHHRPPGQVAIFVLVLAVMLFAFGPKSQEVQHNPSKLLMALFSLVLSAGLSGVGYGIGYMVFG